MATSDQILHIFLNENRMGVLRRKRGGKLYFSYDQEYTRDEGAIPLSLSMPLAHEHFTDEIVSPWLWGLLPDNEIVLARWAQRFHVSPSNCFALLEAIGEDCAGAVRFITPENEDKAAKGGRTRLPEAEIEERLAELKRDPALGREPQDRGQFSLAGAQSKTALQRRGNNWYIPWGREPTTHILKPPRPDLGGHVENEHFCLRLAERLGLSVAKSEVIEFGLQKAICVERYDRVMVNRRLIRVHQEDTCQALGIHPTHKYQSDGGPGAVQIMQLLNRSSRPVEDRRRFMQGVAFNYLIMGSDAHAKNYSLLLGQGGQVRLAKLYDIASLLPYVDRQRECRFAMKVDGYYRDNQIQPRHFEKMARACEFPAAEMKAIILDLAEKMANEMESLSQEMVQNKVDHSVITPLAQALMKRAETIGTNFKKA